MKFFHFQVFGSDIVHISQEEEVSTDVPPRKIDIQLEVKDITSTSAMIKWRFFASHEKQYIDGARIRYVYFITILMSNENVFYGTEA